MRHLLLKAGCAARGRSTRARQPERGGVCERQAAGHRQAHVPLLPTKPALGWELAARPGHGILGPVRRQPGELGKSQFGKLPFKLKFLAKDDQGSATKSPTIAEELAANKSVIGVVGPAFSGHQGCRADLQRVPPRDRDPSASLPALATYGWHNFFRVIPSDFVQGPADALYIDHTLHLNKFFVVNDASTYGSDLRMPYHQAGRTMRR